MPVHEFTLIIENLSELTAEASERLFEAGCDDSSPCSRDGVTYVIFDREAPTLEKAIQSAIDDVRSAGFQVARIDSPVVLTINRFNEQLLAANS